MDVEVDSVRPSGLCCQVIKEKSKNSYLFFFFYFKAIFFSSELNTPMMQVVGSTAIAKWTSGQYPCEYGGYEIVLHGFWSC